jgi:hypothetical protein
MGLMEILHAIADVNAESIIIEKPLGRPMEGAAKCKSNSAPERTEVPTKVAERRQ